MLRAKPVCLFVECVPRSMAALNVLAELDATGLRHGQHALQLTFRQATRGDVLVAAVEELDPTVLHYSGHGDVQGRAELTELGGTLFFENSNHEPVPITAELLDKLLGPRGRHIFLVVLNACNSETFARALLALRSSIKFVVGTSAKITDDEAAAFSRHFYQSLDKGWTVQQAFDTAKAFARVDAQDQAQSFVLQERKPREAESFRLVSRRSGWPLRATGALGAALLAIALAVHLWDCRTPANEDLERAGTSRATASATETSIVADGPDGSDKTAIPPQDGAGAPTPQTETANGGKSGRGGDVTQPSTGTAITGPSGNRHEVEVGSVEVGHSSRVNINNVHGSGDPNVSVERVQAGDASEVNIGNKTP